MPFSIAATPAGVVLTLTDTVSIRDALALADALGASGADSVPVAVDTSALEDVDTCILQLLSSLRKTAPALAFDRPSPRFVKAVDRCGLRRDLLSGREDL